MQQKISTQPTQSNILKVLELLTATTAAFQAFARIDCDFCQPLVEGKRSLTQELAHLIHSEARFSEAIYLALLTEIPHFTDVHPERDWGNLLKFDQLLFAELLVYFRLRRVVLLGVLSRLSDHDWSRTVRETNKKRQESVFWKARALALHEQHHVKIIQTRFLS
jgi:DinB superfamily